MVYVMAELRATSKDTIWVESPEQHRRRRLLGLVSAPGTSQRKGLAMMNGAYPVQFSVDYPDRPLNRLTTAFRLFVAVPILLLLGSVSGGWQWSSQNGT